MSGDQAALLALGGLAVVCLALLVAVLWLRAGWAHTRDEVAALRLELEALAARQEVRASARDREAAPLPEPVEFVITDLGAEPRRDPDAVPLDRAAFADILLRETVVKAASLAHGLRRGLDPATRNRIRFEMKQELRRSRRQRRADLRTARRDLHARQRAALAEEAAS